ncbi:MAG: hypothetical protein CL484_04075 [Acidobacteria bacterium]|nr:hypothetical protein [Acidobacteriota bacterium]|tara:strand:- start:6647 stop:7471 length:825 start_codon:yes stop_codon:yes gene_type:complete
METVPAAVHTTRLQVRLRFIALLTVFLLASCGPPSVEIPEISLDADADRLLFERGSEALELQDWRRAREYFTRIRDNYPQSQFRAESRLGIGESYELEASTEAFIRALNEFEDFLSLYPTHPRAPYAKYKVGMVHFHQMRNAERDQQETLNAIQEFEDFLATYPEAQDLIPEVELRLREARTRFSEHHFTVGRFYYRLDIYRGAISRFRQILEDDPEYSARDEVFYYLGESLAAVEDEAQAIPYFARILNEFESSDYAEPARARLNELEALQDQ